MQLLQASSLALPQFASLSLILPENGMAEPIIALAPTALSCSRDAAMESIREVHGHITSVLRSANSQPSENTVFVSQLLQEEVSFIRTFVQVFRPVALHGVAMYYRFLQNGSTEMSKLQPLLISSSKIDPTQSILGILVCVAITGTNAIFASSPLLDTLPRRIQECAEYFLPRLGDVAACKELLTLYLLTDDECRITNGMAEAPDFWLLPSGTGFEEDRAKGILSSPMSMISPIADFGRKAGRRASTGLVRTDAPAFVETGFSMAPPSAAEAVRGLTDRLTVLSVAERSTFLRKYEHSGQERKANLDITGGTKSRFHRRRKADGRDADFDHFDYKGGPPASSKAETVIPKIKAAVPVLLPIAEPPGKLLPQFKSSAKDTKRGPGSRRLSTQMGVDPDVQSNNRTTRLSDSFDANKGRKAQPQFDDETHDSDRLATRLLVNIALNEDLSCSYKLSQLASCSVDGIVQVQVKASIPTPNIPFSLIVKDPLLHLDVLTENSKYATKVNSTSSLHVFNLVLPEQDKYFSLFKYRCKEDVRPVPIRVQTKVKADGGFCRVALQISSNPNNESNLTDLTIVMSVPDGVRGESLLTQPAGGVWEKSKSAVIWCVSELGRGEKFQLQARFEMQDEEDLQFPVIVRCQCLDVQLSEIELDVQENAEQLPAEIVLKVARRFRLSHREKHN